MNNKGESQRENGVVQDIMSSVPEGGYTAIKLKATFDRAVQSRMVIKQVMYKMYNASSAEEIGQLIEKNFYLDLNTDLQSAKDVYSHQGKTPIVSLLEFLDIELNKYKALDSTQKEAVNKSVFAQKDLVTSKNWTGFYTVISKAIAAETP